MGQCLECFKEKIRSDRGISLGAQKKNAISSDLLDNRCNSYNIDDGSKQQSETISREMMAQAAEKRLQKPSPGMSHKTELEYYERKKKQELAEEYELKMKNKKYALTYK